MYIFTWQYDATYCNVCVCVCSILGPNGSLYYIYTLECFCWKKWQFWCLYLHISQDTLVMVKRQTQYFWIEYVNIAIEIDLLMLGKVISEIIWNKMDLLKHKVQIFNKFEFMVASLQSRTNANGIVQNDAPLGLSNGIKGK